MEAEVKCPSGLEGTIRALKVKDEKLFTDTSLLKSGTLTPELCKRCWIETKDLGPYPFEDGSILWPEVLQGDTFWLFLQIRGITYGDDHEFSYQCDSCRSSNTHPVNLQKDLIQKPLPEASLEAYRDNTPLETTLEDGRGVKFRLLFAKDDKHIMRLQRSKDFSRRNAVIATRLLGVEGLEVRSPFDLQNFIEDLDSGEADLLEEKMEEQDCGVDTDLLVTCDRCFHEQVLMLPFEASFFQRRKKHSVRRAEEKKEKLRAQKKGG
jgi:hypothetical protein